VAIATPRSFLSGRRLEASQLIVWTIGAVLLGIVFVGSVLTLRAGHYTAAQWRDFIVFGIAQGSIYALIALGYTMVYGVLRMINFAHGEVFMSGAMTTFFLADYLNRSGFLKAHPWISLIAMLLFSGFVSMTIAVLVERIAYRPLRGAPRLVPLITAVGASFFLQYTFRGLFGSGVRAYPAIPVLQGKLWVFQKTQIAVFVGVAITLLLLVLFLQRTRAGLAIRAVAEDREAAALMGVDVDRAIVTTFAVGGFMAGIAGVLYALVFIQVQFFMGFLPGIKAFTAAVLGGIGNLPGAAVGGLVLGIIESVGPSLFFDGYGIRAAHQLKDVIAFTILVLILIFRPTGILGERLGGEERV
jgi:branched-chain amino acid transport system permease protein